MAFKNRTGQTAAPERTGAKKYRWLTAIGFFFVSR